jgi:hypothetical protein
MVYQSDPHACGKACVRDVTVIVYEDEGYGTESLREDCQDFASIGRELSAQGLLYGPYAVDDLSGITKGMLPAIAEIDSGGVSHFVVVKKIGKHQLSIDDPEFGPYRMKKEEFRLCFQGKMMLREGLEKKPPVPELRLFKTKEKIAYALLFLFGTLSLLGFGYFMNQSAAFPFLLFFGFLSLTLFALLNLLNRKVRDRLDAEVLLPYLKREGKPEDFPLLSHILDETVKKASDLVTYGTLSLLLVLLLSANGLLLSLLAVLSLLFPLLRLSLFEERNGTERACAVEERKYLSRLALKDPEAEKDFAKAKAKAGRFYGIALAQKLFEAGLLSLFILLIMMISQEWTLNFFLFHLVLSFSLASGSEKLLLSSLQDDPRTRLLNSLSVPLSEFLLKKDLALDYNKETDGGLNDGEERSHSGLSGQSGGEKRP